MATRNVYLFAVGDDLMSVQAFSSLKSICNQLTEKHKLPSYSKLSKDMTKAKKENEGKLRVIGKDGGVFNILVLPMN